MPSELTVYSGLMWLNSSQVRVVMAADTFQRFSAATGLSKEWVGKTGNDEEIANAMAHPNKLLAINSEYKNGGWVFSFVEVPEENWHWNWRELLKKKANSITKSQFVLLLKLADGYTPTAKEQEALNRLEELKLIERLPLGIALTETGRVVAEYGTETSTLDVRVVLRRYEESVKRQNRQSAENYKAEVNAAKEGILEAVSAYFEQRGSFDDIGTAYDKLMRIQTDSIHQPAQPGPAPRRL